MDKQANADMICNVLAEQDRPGVHEDSLCQFHVRLGHQSYAAIEELASKPESGIKLIDRKRPHCIACAEGKQTRYCFRNTPNDAPHSPASR
jgi:hypothetical protein